MEENSLKAINELIDQLEKGKISQQEFLNNVLASGLVSVGIGPLVVAPPTDLKESQRAKKFTDSLLKSGVVVRIQEVDLYKGNRIEGLVQPGALEFWQTFTEGSWEQEILEGKALVNIEGKEVALSAGETFRIEANQRFKFLNPNSSPWRFVAHHPAWQPFNFFYEFDEKRIAGYEMWFELKSSATDPLSRPLYHILSAGGTGTFSIVVLEPGMKTLKAYYTDGANIITAIAGEGMLNIEYPEPRSISLERGASSTVPLETKFQLENAGESSVMFEVRPDEPRMWDPAVSFWEIGAEEFVTGDAVWFEYIIPC